MWENVDEIAKLLEEIDEIKQLSTNAVESKKNCIGEFAE